MLRHLRIQYPGAMYHVINRGDQREPVFKDDEDREKSLGTLGETCRKTDWQVHAYCLMSNHFYLVLETPQPNRVFGMILGEKGIPGDTAAGREQFAAQMERRRMEEAGADYEALRRDWILGSEAFRQELLAAMAGQVGRGHDGAQRRETDQQKAERMLREELQRLGLAEEQMLAQRKGAAMKVALGRHLRQETTMSLKWIAERLRMGSWTYVSNLIAAKVITSQPEALLPLFKYED
jgi:REP element-mobilizing transposase RayT